MWVRQPLEHFQENARPREGGGGVRFSVRKCDNIKMLEHFGQRETALAHFPAMWIAVRRKKCEPQYQSCRPAISSTRSTMRRLSLGSLISMKALVRASPSEVARK